MDDFDPAELARIRRYGRADWRRLWPPGWERGLNPAQIAAQRKEFAKWERAFETPLARRLRKEAEERAQMEQERLQAEIERDVLAMKAEVASMRAELNVAEFRWKAECAERKRQADLAWERFMAAFKRGDFRRKANFDPDQPRDEQGRWTDAGGGTEGDQNDVNPDAEDTGLDHESLAQDRRTFVAPGPGQEPRRTWSILMQLQTIQRFARGSMRHGLRQTQMVSVESRVFGFRVTTPPENSLRDRLPTREVWQP